MSDDDVAELDVKNLEKIIKALKKGKSSSVKVGIFGNNQKRSDGGNNATIGAFHEFGTSTLPQRSFLRIPIQDNLEKRLEASGLFDKEALRLVVADGSIARWLEIVSIVCEGIVLDAFDTGGFGKWKPSDMTHKRNHQTLVETQQLRGSVTAVVKE